MAGLQRREARFDALRPTWAQVVERAQSLGGLALREEHDQIHFVEIPDMYVVMHLPADRPDCIYLTDYSQDLPAVMLLVEHALVHLGGHMDPAPQPLPLPLTIDFVRRDRRSKHWMLRAGCLLFSLALVLGFTLLLALAWGAWAGVRALFAG